MVKESIVVIVVPFLIVVPQLLLLFLSCYCCSGSDNIIVFSDLQSTHLFTVRQGVQRR